MRTTPPSECNSQLLSGDMIFPCCGLPCGDLVATAEMCRNKNDAADKLGVSDAHLDRVIKQCDLNSIFSKQAGELFAGVPAVDLLKVTYRCVNVNAAALALGVSPSYFTKP